jgi:5'-nucleotidase
MYPYGDIVCKIAASGNVILQALNTGVAKLPKPGVEFPQVSGITFHVAPSESANRVQDVRINGEPLDPDRTYTVALGDHMLTGVDGYTMFGNQNVLVSREQGHMIVAALEKYVSTLQTIGRSPQSRITMQR